MAIAAFAGAAGLTAAAYLKIPAAELVALSLAAIGIWGTLGPFWAMSSEILSGTGAAAGIALINSVGDLGGFLGPYLVGLVRQTTDSFELALLALAVCPLIGAVVTILARNSTAGAAVQEIDHWDTICPLRLFTASYSTM